MEGLGRICDGAKKVVDVAWAGRAHKVKWPLAERSANEVIEPLKMTEKGRYVGFVVHAEQRRTEEGGLVSVRDNSISGRVEKVAIPLQTFGFKFHWFCEQAQALEMNEQHLDSQIFSLQRLWRVSEPANDKYPILDKHRIQVAEEQVRRSSEHRGRIRA